MKAIFLLIVVTTTLSFAGCGGSAIAADEDASYAQYAGNETTAHTPGGMQLWQPPPDDPRPFDGETLTIATARAGWWLGYMQRMAQVFMWHYPGVTVEVIDFDGDRVRGLEQIGVQLMSGTAPVLIDNAFVDHHNPSNVRFLADWFPFINADPYFNNEYYFMNVFHASAINGRAYVFPHEFRYRLVTANSTIPGLANALAEYDGVTITQIMELRHHFPTETPLYFGYDFDVAIGVMWDYLHSFLDMETGWVDFNNQRFIDFINYLREITSPETIFGQRGFGFIAVSPEEESVWSQRYYFQYINPFIYQYFLDFQEDLLFTGVTPIVDNQGRVIINVWGHALNAQATPIQQALAFRFMLFLNSVEAHNAAGMWPPWVPVNRELLHLTIERNFLHEIETMVRTFGWRLDGTRSEAIETIFARRSAIEDMPMTTIQVPNAIINIIFEALRDFHYGLISAEQTAQDLQNRITLVMMEME